MNNHRTFKRIAFMLLFMQVIATATSQTIENYQKHFATESWQPKSFMGFTSTTAATPPSGAATFTVTVDPSTVKCKIPSTIFGTNCTYYGGNDPTTNTEAARYYKAINSSAIRFPGGTPSDVYFWDADNDNDYPSWFKKGTIAETNYKGTNINADPQPGEHPWGIKLSKMYAYLKANPTQNAVFQVNYSAAIYAQLPTRDEKVKAAADYAAAWVKDANITNGLKVKYWEVGNEIGRDWTPTGRNANGTQHNVGGTEFAQDFIVFAKAMKAVDPTIRVGACGDDFGGFTEQCLKVQGFKEACDFLAVHDYYGAWNSSHSESSLIAEGDAVQGTADKYRTIFEKASLSRDAIPLALTEWNTAAVRDYATVSQGGAILHAKAIGKEIEAGFGMVNMFAMSDYFSDKKDLGMISHGGTEYPEGTPYPVYYTYAYYAKTFGDVMIQSTCSDNGVRVYSSKFSSAPFTGTVIINTTNQDKIVDLKIGGTTTSYFYYEMVPETKDFFCRKTVINGKTTTAVGGGPSNFENIAPYSGSAANGIKIDIKAYGIYFVMVASNTPVLASIEIAPVTKTPMVGVPFQFTMKYFDKDHNEIYYDKKPSWSVSGGGSIDANGLFTPSTSGSFTVSATIQGPGGTTIKAMAVPFTTEVPVLSKIAVTAASSTVGVGETIAFKATGYDQKDGSMTISPTWSVSGGGTIDNTGVFTAETVGGPYTVTIKQASFTASTTITVKPGCTVYSIEEKIEAETWCKQGGTVQTETTTDAGGGLNVGYIDADDWMSYTIAVPAPGLYTMNYRVASASGGGSIELKIGNTVLAKSSIASTGDWQKWITVSKDITLSAGTTELTVYAAKGGFNINWLKLSAASDKCATYTINDRIEAESWCQFNNVKTETTSDTGAGLNVGYIVDGSWMSYTINVPVSGSYKAQFRVASQGGGGVIELKSGTTLISSTNVTATGDWQTWATISQDITLPAGTSTLTVFAAKGGFNLNWLSIAGDIPVLKKIVITPSTGFVEVGKNQQFVAQAYDTNDKLIAISPTWSVTGVGTIDAKGLYTATSLGSFTVTSSCNGITSSITLSTIHTDPIKVDIIDDQDNNTVTIGPSPVHSTLHISSKKTPITGVVLYTITGSIVKNYSCGGSNAVDIDVSQLEEGLYFVEIKSGSTSMMKEMVKQP